MLNARYSHSAFTVTKTVTVEQSNYPYAVGSEYGLASKDDIVDVSQIHPLFHKIIGFFTQDT